jgi:catechol 2,3-dioxygenase-like lactoylglutathione lyase family enzyme
MDQRISMITLGVSDLAKAVGFYEGVLGWTRAPGPDGIAFFDLGGLVFSLYPNTELVKEFKGDAVSSPGAGCEAFTLAHNVASTAEVDAIFAGLKEHGARILKAPETVFWGGYSGYFADIDGHAWEVAHNPFWRIGSDGRIDMSPQ